MTYLLTPIKWRNYTALFWSVVFYIWGAPQFIFVLVGSVTIDFFLAKKIVRSEGKERKYYFAISLLLNVGLLAYFKYANFFVENVQSLLELMGWSSLSWTAIALPIGISFFTFQKLSYIIDIYRGQHQALEKWTDLLLYIMLFPQLIAGPIVRYSEIDQQLRDRRDQENIDYVLNGFFRFTIGLSKKVLIANPLSELADGMFALSMTELTMGQAWLGSVAYAFQIYFDFSGYSDMAIGLGLMMGFRFPENFNAPYISQNITEFWRRWHITLSQWMRDYLYIPLGGSRVDSTARLYFNLWVVFLISGLWHGAAWTFIVWGIFHGVFLVLDRLFLLKFYKIIGKPLSIIITFGITLIGWVIFRADNLEMAFQYIGTMLDVTDMDWSINTQKAVKPYYLEFRFKVLLLIAAFFSFLPVFSWVEKNMNQVLDVDKRLYPTLIKTLITLVLLFICMAELIATGVNPFIYFRF